MTQKQHVALGHGAGQVHRIYKLLLRRCGQWVPMPALARAASPNHSGIGLSPRSRIYDLRAMLRRTRSALRVEHREKHCGGQVHSWYRLARAV
jgi:hypothetical protein